MQQIDTICSYSKECQKQVKVTINKKCSRGHAFVLEFYGPVNNKVMSSRSVNSDTVPGQALTF